MAKQKPILARKDVGIIESTSKSRQRLQNELNQLRNLSDANDAFEND